MSRDASAGRPAPGPGGPVGGADPAAPAAAAPEPAEWRRRLRRVGRSPLTVAGLLLVAAVVALAAFGPQLAPYDPLEQRLDLKLAPPGPGHPLGRDALGRDILSRILHGVRISLGTAVGVVAATAVAGGAVGLIAGLLGGLADEVIMRVTDMFFAFPSLVLAMAIAALLGPSLTTSMIAIAAVWWPVYARLMRGQVLAVREREFVEAARAVGATRTAIALRHVLPNALTPVLVQATLDLGGVVLTAAGLSFIGFGAQPPTPELGVMVAEGRNYITQQWWVSTFPGLAILVMVLGFNLLGDGVRDVMDPRGRG